ncbi:MAG: hypothetical protein RLZZ210_1584 [Pseudomonadota bacterium]|jgi:hypothetical protein
MSYSDYQYFKQIQKDFAINYQIVESLFPQIEIAYPSDFLIQILKIAKSLPSTHSEKSRSENLITPILWEVYQKQSGRITLFSGCKLNINEKLSGICDYIIANKKSLLELDSPIVCIVEAKHRTLEEGFAQAGAEMIASRIFNQKNDSNINIIYGVVTNGIDWRFLKLQDDILYIDQEIYFSSTDYVAKLLGVFNQILTNIQS